MSKKSKNPVVESDVFDITTAAEHLQLSPVYVRRAIRKGELKTNLVPIAEGSKIVKHEITLEALNAWRATAGARTRRADGRSRYLMHATAEELDALKALLANTDLGVIISKQKAYKKGEAEVEAELQPTE